MSWMGRPYSHDAESAGGRPGSGTVTSLIAPSLAGPYTGVAPIGRMDSRTLHEAPHPVVRPVAAAYRGLVEQRPILAGTDRYRRPCRRRGGAAGLWRPARPLAKGCPLGPVAGRRHRAATPG